MKNNFSIYFLFFLAIVAFANLFVFLSIGTIISTAILMSVFIVSIVYIFQLESYKDKAENEKITFYNDFKEYKNYLEHVPTGILILDRNKNIVFINDKVPTRVSDDLKSENPCFDYFLTIFNSFLESGKENDQAPFLLEEKNYLLKFNLFSPNDEQFIMIGFLENSESVVRDNKRVYKKFWDFLKGGPVAVISTYLEEIRDSVNQINQDIFLTDNSRKQIDTIMRILDKSRDDIENLSIMVHPQEIKLEKYDVVAMFKKITSDIGADKDFVKINLINNLNLPAELSLHRESMYKVVKNISDNVSEFTRSKKLDIEFNYTFQAGTDNRVVEIRFISADGNIDNSIFNKLGKGIKTSKQGKHLGLGLEIVKRVTIAQGGEIDFRKASNGFTIALLFKV